MVDNAQGIRKMSLSHVWAPSWSEGESWKESETLVFFYCFFLKLCFFLHFWSLVE